MNAPRYVDLPGSSTYPPPISKTGCDARVYVLRANRTVLQEAIDQWLNVPINDVYHYIALPWIAMFTMPIQEIRHIGARPGSPWAGSARESDVAFAATLAAVRKSPFRHRPVVDHFAIAFPFILVNNPLGLTTGREVWGFRQAYGHFECLPGTSMPISASTPVMTRYSEYTEQAWKEVMRMGSLIDDLALAPGDTIRGRAEHLLARLLVKGGSALQQAGGFVEQAAEKAVTTAGDWALRFSSDTPTLAKQFVGMMQTIKGITQETVGIGTAASNAAALESLAESVITDVGDLIFRGVEDARLLLQKFLDQTSQIKCAFLMQLRDCAVPSEAAYQALIEAPLKITGVQSVLPIPRTTVTLADYASYPLVSSLGIIPDGPGHDDRYDVKPLMAFETQCSLDVMTGRVIAEAGRTMMGAAGMPL